MKKILISITLCFFLALFAHSVFAQINNGVRVVYAEKIKIDESKFNHLDPDTKASLLEKLAKPVMAELIHQGSKSTYTTNFEDSKSYTKNISGDNTDIKVAISQMATNFWYKDFASSTFYSSASIKDEKYLIKDSIASNWELLDEFEKIDSFKCQKAILKQAYGMRNIVAWFTQEIPINDGPQFYAGLPGLILKVELEKKIFYVTKISFFNSTVSFPAIPTQGIVKTLKEFNNSVAAVFSPANNKTISTNLPNGTKTVTNNSSTY